LTATIILCDFVFLFRTTDYKEMSFYYSVVLKIDSIYLTAFTSP